MQKRIVALILAILVLAAAIVYFLNRNGRNPGNQIVVSGNIELTEVNIAFKTAGRLIERSVDEGDIVKKGQVIARLDQDQLLAQRNREDAGLQSARSLLAQAETALAWQRGNQAAELEQRRAELASYQARLQELKSGSRPEEIQEAKAAVDSAQAEYDRAKRDWERAQTLYKNDDISTAQYDQYRSRWENAEAMLKQIKERQAPGAGGSAQRAD
jgi:HlyD family secretion protein